MTEEQRIEEIKTFLQTAVQETLDYDLSKHEDVYEITSQYIDCRPYMIGTYQAIQWLGDDAFYIIGEIKDHQQDEFGRVFCDFSNPEEVVNTYALMKGEEMIRGIVKEYLAELLEQVQEQEDLDDLHTFLCRMEDHPDHNEIDLSSLPTFGSAETEELLDAHNIEYNSFDDERFIWFDGYSWEMENIAEFIEGAKVK